MQRRALGIAVNVTPLSRRLARKLDLLGESAIEVVSVAAGGAAQEAGLFPGDWIVAVNGRIVETPDDLHRIFSGQTAAVPLEVTVIRDGGLVERTVRPK